MAALLCIQGLHRSFDGFAALAGVDLRVEEGEIRSIIGPNGAGKTTLFNIITGLHPPSAGRVLFEGRDIGGLSPHRIARRGIARAFQIVNLFPGLTVLENLRLGIQARSGATITEQVETAARLLTEIGLDGRATVRARDLSHGEQRRLEIGIAVATDPRLLLLDEPMAGLNQAETWMISDLIVSLARRRTIVLIEHDLDVVMRISTGITVLHQGSVLTEGSPREIQQNAKVRRIYLGGTL